MPSFRLGFAMFVGTALEPQKLDAGETAVGVVDHSVDVLGVDDAIVARSQLQTAQRR
jgi:hypothetical protein